MATLVTLTRNDGEKVYINPQHIVIVEPCCKGSTVITDVVTNDYGTINRTPKKYIVKEDPNTIIWLMKNS